MAWWPTMFVFSLVVLVFAPIHGVGQEKQASRPVISHAAYETEYPINANGDLIMLPARLRGRDCLFFFETGFTLPAFFPPAHSLLGPKLREDTPRTVIAASSTYTIHAAPSFNVCGLTIPAGAETYAITGRVFQGVQLLGYPADGLLGMEVLRHTVVQINFDRGTLQWLRKFEPTDEIPIRLHQESPRLTPHALVLFPGHGWERFTIDTGSNALHGATIEHELFEKLQKAGWFSILEQRIPIPTFSGSDARYVKAGFLNRDVEVDSMPLPDCAFVDSGEGGANTLGMSFLTRFNITFDFPKGFLYLKPRRNMNRPDRRNLSGLVASRPADEPLVHFVVPNSAAAKAGLEAKDVMVRINQKDARRLTCYEIEFELSESGATMPLTVRRGSRLIDVKITLPTITPPKRVAVDTSKKKFLPDNE